ncbi:MAG: pyridoxamine 5'-phosphate oxidase [Bacteroidia bacterium]
MDMVDRDLARLRQEYSQAALDEATLPDEPFTLLARWLEEAIAAKVPEPNAFTLATVDRLGQPHARVVLLKGFTPPYLYFYTNYESAKAQQLAYNPYAAMVFWWAPLERQVRIVGPVEKAPPEVSDAYFQSRPLSSQLGAWASPQSRPITRSELEARWAEYQKRFGEGPVPRPSFWGGYRLKAEQIEFWQGRSHRLHDRILYRQRETQWEKIRLAP